MLTELNQDARAAALPLFATLENNLVTRSIAAGNAVGSIWVDDAARPTFGVTWNGLDWALVAGEPDEANAREVRRVIEATIDGEQQARFVPGLSLFFDRPTWDAWVEPVIFAGRKIHRYTLTRFVFEGLRVNPRSQLPAGFRLRRIDADLLADESIDQGAMKGWISSFWPSEERFLHNGVGYAVLEDDTVAAWSLSVFADEKEAELGVETVKAFRGKGLATAVAGGCVEFLQASGRTPVWHCMSENLPSLAVGKKVGFRPTGTTPVVWGER